MTEVLSIQQPNGHSPFGSPLRRSPSNASFRLHAAPSYPNPQSYYNGISHPYESGNRLTLPDPPSAPSSTASSPNFLPPEFSRQASYTTSLSSSHSFNGNDYRDQLEDEESYFPPYDDCDSDDETEVTEPAASPEGPPVQQNDQLPTIRSSAISQSHLYNPAHATGDDMAMRRDPSGQVDYLSHTWKEEDIWASWKHVAGRRKLLTNGPRLENASWRTWGKCKYRLKTFCAEDLNWMKDHDVTWLYGPLQTGTYNLGRNPTPAPSQVSRNDSFAMKKPILKKRSISEAMLQRSLSSSTLMKQATDALRAQQLVRFTGGTSALGEHKVSDFISWSGAETPLTRATTDTTSSGMSSSATSGTQTPATRRHIHFNDKVEQCIAINCDNEDHHYHPQPTFGDDESSEDDMLVMQPAKNPFKATPRRPSTPRTSFSNESRIIAMLPSTTLNCRGDTPDPENQLNELKQAGCLATTSHTRQSPRPSAPAPDYPFDEEDEDADIDWQPSMGQGDNLWQPGGITLQPDSEDEDDEPDTRGMRRTPSGMFMPYDDDDDEYPRDGLIGRVVDTVNTARDIAHVIWNVGWRRSE